MEEKVILLKKNQENKLKMAPDSIKEFYSTIRNALSSYANVKERMMVSCDGYKLGKEYLAKITVSGKTMKLFLALDPSLYDQSKFHHTDVSDKKTYLATPFMVKIASKLAVKRAVLLIDELAKKNNLSKIEGYEDFDFLKLYPYIENAEFEKATKKTTPSKKAVALEDEIVEESPVVEEVKEIVDNVNEEVSNEIVESLSPEDKESELEIQIDLYIEMLPENKNISRRLGKAVVNVGMFDANFDDEEINLSSLKEKGLIHRNAKEVKVLGSGNVTKAHKLNVNSLSKSAKIKLQSTGSTF